VCPQYIQYSHKPYTVTVSGGFHWLGTAQGHRRGVMLTDEIGLAGEMSSYFEHRPSVVSLYREQSAVLKPEIHSI